MDPIETWRIQQFKNTVETLLQERGGKLRSTVTFSGGYVGKGARPVNQIGETEAEEDTGRYQDSPNMHIDTDARWLFPRRWRWGKLIDDVDRVQTGIAPDGEFTKAGVQAMERVEDRAILEAFFGVAKAGENGATNMAFPSANEVGVQVGGGGSDTGMNHEKLREGLKKLAGNFVEIEGEEKYLIITEHEWAQLFGINTTVSVDFVEGRPISSGKLPPLYGLNIVPFASATLRKHGLISAANVASLPLWCKSGMHLGAWKERETKVGPDPTKEFNIRIFMRQIANATRLQEGKVIRVLSKHS